MQDNQHNSGGVSNKAMEIATALIILAFGAIVMWDSWRIGAGWTAEGPQSGSFPFYVGLFIVISAIVTLVGTVRRSAEEQGEFVGHDELKLVLAVLFPSIAYVILIEFIGMYVASAIFIAFFMIWQGKFSIVKSLTISILVNFFFLVMFEIAFKIPLPKKMPEDLAVAYLSQLARTMGL